jgi:hypothetical protein
VDSARLSLPWKKMQESEMANQISNAVGAFHSATMKVVFLPISAAFSGNPHKSLPKSA